MVRVKPGPTRRRKHKKILKLAKGYKGARSRRFRDAKQAVIRSLVYAYMHRKEKKRLFRRLWIVRINAALSGQDLRYAQFVHGLKKAGVALDRKMLAEIAVRHPEAFQEIVSIARSALGR